MPHTPSTNGTPAEDFQAAIAQINQLLREGRTLSEIDLTRRFPHLMPKLEESARDLQMIINAEKAVKVPGPGEQDTPEREHRVALLDVALAGYQVVDILQEGGQGTVFRGHQLSTQRDVAIKVMGGSQFSNERRAKRFAREIRLVSRLQLPNIVPVYDSGVVNGQPYFVMPMIYGMPADKYAFLNAPEARMRNAMFVKIARAVSRAHQRGIIHRDLKPTNILIDDDGEPQILDFGLAKAMGEPDAEDNISLIGHVVGTLPYLSPEQATGFTTLDIRSDVYALGVLLFELLTGVYPYDVDGDKEKVRENIIRANPRSLKEALVLGDSTYSLKPVDFDNDLQAIVSMAIAKNKNERYQSADALADDLDRYLSGGVVQARIDHRWYLSRRMIRKYRVQVATTITIFALLIWSNLRTKTHQVAAQKERDLARSFAALAQNTLGHLVTKVDEEIESLAGGKVVRKSLLDDVADRLSEMNDLIGSDPSLASLSVSLQEKQGDIARSDGRAEEAEVLYLQAAAQLVNAPASQVIRARLYRKAGNASGENGTHFDNAIRIARVAATSKDSEGTIELAHVLVDMARFNYLHGEHIRAGEFIDESLSMFKGRIAHVQLHARALEWAGDIRIKLGDLTRSRELLDKSLQLRDQLLKSRPFDVRIKHEHMQTSMKLGFVLGALGEFDSAITQARTAVAAGAYLCSIDAGDINYRNDSLSAEKRLAWVLRQSGDLNRAMDIITQSIARARAYQSAIPGGDQSRRSLGSALEERSRIHCKSGSAAPALKDALASLDIRTMLIGAKSNKLDLYVELATANDAVGSCLQRMGRHADAKGYLLAAHDIYDELLERQPNAPDRAITLCVSEINLAAWHIRHNTPANDEQARSLLRSAEDRLLSINVKPEFLDRYLRIIQRNRSILTRSLR